ncbi:MAG: ABC transporter substrate-binding protein [Lachnospiraceae bacterium]|nr:ABC transporter substrate-binding protein [Lachnospiraceae bacterium]MBP5250536.1 ABC transporter substrate-binding protein [Lachnospiraceae bacterium]
MKKRLIAATLLFGMLIPMLLMSGCGKKEVLKLYLPGEYLGDGVISGFEKAYNCKVIIENFDSNEMMYTKISAGDSYDVLIPSDYMIERLLKEDQLQKLDKSLITNIGNLAPEVTNLSFDPDNSYSVPYFWGNVGIVYAKNRVDIADLEKDGFGIFLNEKYKGNIYVYDSERDMFMCAFKTLGYSCNTENEDEILEAYDWLVKIGKTMSPVYVTDEIIDNMLHEYEDLGIMYSGDAAYITSENENLGYYVPESGTNIWFDAMVIPKNAANPELANKFINYMCTEKAARLNTQGVGYASPVASILKEMTSEDGDYFENEAYYPRTNANDELFHDSEYLRKRLSELWIKVKAASE